MSKHENDARNNLKNVQHDEASLNDDVAFLKEIAGASPSIIFVLDLKSKEIIYINKAVKEHLRGSPPGSFLHNKNIFTEIAHPEDYKKWMVHIDHLESLADDAVIGIELRLKTESDHYRLFRIRESIFKRDADGKAIQSTGTIYDIDETKIPTVEPFTLSIEFISFLENSPRAAMVLKALRNSEGKITDFEYIFSNSKALMAIQRANVTGKLLTAEFPSSVKTGLFDHYVSVIETGQYWEDDIYYNGDGFEMWSQVNATNLNSQYIVTHFEVIEREEKSAGIKKTGPPLDNIEEACYELDKNGNLFFVNNKAMELFGMKKDEMVGRNIWAIFPEAKKSLCYEAIQVQALDKKKFAQFQYRSEVLGTMISLSAGPTAKGCIVIFHEALNS